MEFSDMRITIDEYFKILSDAWEHSPYFSSWEEQWHPEDLFSNFDSVARGVGEGLVSYATIVGQHMRKRNPNPYDSNKKTVDDMTIQEKIAEERVNRLDNLLNVIDEARINMFGGSVPKDTVTNNPDPIVHGNVFGDNV
jgi:hypothetical protein